MSKKQLQLLVGIICLMITTFFWFIPDDKIQATLISLISVESESEKEYILNFLTPSLFLKLRLAILLTCSILLALSIIWPYFWPRFKAEWTNSVASLRSSINDFGSVPFYLLIGLVLIVTFSAIPNVQLNSDEAYAFEYFTSQNPLISIATYPAPNNHIFYSLVSSVIHKVIPLDLWALRMPSAIAFTLSFALLILYLSRRFNKRSAIIAMLGILFSFYPLFYAVQGRGYSILLLCSTALTILGIESILKSKLQKPILLSIISVIGFYTIPVFLYPFTFFLLIFLFFISFKEVLKLAIATSIITTLLYAPIILFFGLDVLVNNEFVQSISYSEMFHKLTSYWRAEIIHYLPLFMLAAYSVFSVLKDKRNSKIHLIYLILLVLSLLIPIVHLKFPPFRAYIYLFPMATIVFSDFAKKQKLALVVAILFLIYNIYFAKKQYYAFNLYSLEAHEILDNAVERGAEKIYLLDGPRSIFKWYCTKEYRDVELKYSLNREALDMNLLEDESYYFISEYRWEELDEFRYEVLDSTDYFRLFVK